MILEVSLFRDGLGNYDTLHENTHKRTLEHVGELRDKIDEKVLVCC